jgi:hypothetical protein
MHMFHFANCEISFLGGFNKHPTPSLESILITTHGYSSVAKRFWIISSRSISPEISMKKITIF